MRAPVVVGGTGLKENNLHKRGKVQKRGNQKITAEE